MAEVLGVASGIVGILSLTIQITQLIVQFGLDWKDAPKEAKALMSELQSLKTILSETQTNLILNPDFHDAFQNRSSVLLSELGPRAPPTTDTKLSIKSCESELNHLLEEVKKGESGRRMGWERFKAPFCAKSLHKSVDKLHRQCRSLNDMVSIDALSVGVDTLGEVKQARKEQQAWFGSQEDQKVLTWLSDLSFEEKHKDVFSKRYHSTGEWFLELDSFKAWRNGVSDVSSIMWCTGIPGAGKSVMTSVVIEHIQEMFTDEHVSISYIYCDYKDHKNQTANSLLGSLVKQIVSQHKQIPEEITNLRAECKGSPSLKDHTMLLSSLSKEFKRSFILVDALDEHFTNEDDEDGLEMTLLDELLQLQRKEDTLPSFSMFLTSRENLILRERLEGCVRAEIYATDGDIQSYLQSRIYDHTKFRFAGKVREDPELAESIVKSLSNKAQGMFLLPRLHLDRLSCQTSIRGLRAALNSLPTKLDDIYDEAIIRIQGQVPEHCELAKLALTWISHAHRPLEVFELQHALAVRPGDRDLDPEAVPDIALVVSVSAGLIMIDPESQAVRLVHFTVEEYFKKKTAFFPRADILIAETCMTYLSFHRFTDDALPSEVSSSLLDYAAKNWGSHLHGEAERVLQEQVLDFLSDDQNLKQTGSTIHNTMASSELYYWYEEYYWYEDFIPSRLHVIVYFDLVNILSMYLEKDYSSEIEDGSFYTSLHLAAAKGHMEAVKILIDQAGIDANHPDKYQKTPLTVAAMTGRETISRMLLDRDDVQPDYQDCADRTPLSRAAECGHESIVEILLSRTDVIADSKDRVGLTPLSYAAERGHENIVKMLLDRNDVVADSEDDENRTPLSYAAEEGYEEIVKILLSRDDVNANSLDWSHRTPLWYAARSGCNTIVQLLLGREDVRLDREDEDGKTPLSIAREMSHKDTVRLLGEEIARRYRIEQASYEEGNSEAI